MSINSFNFPSSGLLGFDVIVCTVPMSKVQRRIHPRKKRRLQKKWAARYGYDYVIAPGTDLNEILVDERRHRIYCYPQTEMRISE